MSGKLIAGHLEVFRDNIETEFKMECCTCNTSFIEYYDVGCIDNYDKTKKEFSQKAYRAGWRYSNSTVFQHKGIHCPTCHKHRNNKKHFD
jgi:hypothetical protein